MLGHQRRGRQGHSELVRGLQHERCHDEVAPDPHERKCGQRPDGRLGQGYHDAHQRAHGRCTVHRSRIEAFRRDTPLIVGVEQVDAERHVYRGVQHREDHEVVEQVESADTDIERYGIDDEGNRPEGEETVHQEPAQSTGVTQEPERSGTAHGDENECRECDCEGAVQQRSSEIRFLPRVPKVVQRPRGGQAQLVVRIVLRGLERRGCEENERVEERQRQEDQNGRPGDADTRPHRLASAATW